MIKGQLSFDLNERSCTHESLMFLLILCSCFISSCPQNVISILKDTSSNANSYINLNEETNNVNNSFLNSVQIENLSSGHLHVDLNSGVKEKGDLSEKKHLANKFLEGNYSYDIDNNNSSYNISWWTDISTEIAELLSNISGCSGWKFRCFYNETNRERSRFRRRQCDCDSSCDAYGGCCIDKFATMSRHEKISFKNRMHCELLSK
ncbi:hypothetical protein Anas_06387, partial [Armadillidium nasatum]